MERRAFLRSCVLTGFGTAGLASRAHGTPGSGTEEYDLLLQGGHVIDPASALSAVRDVAVKDGVIAAVARDLPEHAARQVADVRGLYVSPGFVDLHVHGFVGHASGLSVDAGENGVGHGVTTVVDAGTSGADDLPAFVALAARSPVRMLAFLNIARGGMYVSEQDPRSFASEAAAQAVLAHPELCVGIKSAHYWTTEPYDSAHLPWASVDAGLAAARACGRPAMFDFCPRPAAAGWPARTYRELLLDRMMPGDLHTHCYARISEYQFPVLDERGKVNQYILEAQASGRLLDVGHGGGSFHWANAEPAVQQGYLPDSISTDLHRGNINGPVFSLPYVMSKFLALGVPLEEVVRRVTVNPAKAILRPDLGRLQVALTADLAVFELAWEPTRFLDVQGQARAGDRLIENLITVCGGKVLFDRDGRVWDRRTGIPAEAPAPFVRLASYPNPFSSSTTIVVTVREAGPAILGIHDGLGQRVVTLADELLAAGTHEYTWQGTDQTGRSLASGVYFLSFSQGLRTMNHRVSLVR
ncbi:MAG: FlgD immunoglobulin-like domain containing protein [Candidatus Latescibacterota bacterium]|jgi:dihydroorotase